MRERRDASAKIRTAVDDYCEKNFGIPNFSAVADRCLGRVSGDEALQICQARQIFTTNIEHVALDVVPDWLSAAMGMPVESLPISFERDAFLRGNDFKTSLVNVPKLRKGRNGIFVENKRIVPQTELRNGVILGEMKTLSGETLSALHSRMRTEAGLKAKPIDIAPFFSEILRECVARKPQAAPSFVFVKSGNSERRVPIGLVDWSADIRPPADWYYRFYLMLFVSGERALLSTVGDEDNPEVDNWFKNSIAEIRNATGFEPLIIGTPNEVELDGLKSGLLEHPEAVFALKGWRSSLRLPAPDPNLSVFEAKQAIELGLIELVKGMTRIEKP